MGFARAKYLIASPILRRTAASGSGVSVVSRQRMPRVFQEPSSCEQARDGLTQDGATTQNHRDGMTEARQMPALPATSRMIRAGYSPPQHYAGSIGAMMG